MERLVLALVLVALGGPLWAFGVAVATNRFDLVFGEYTAETTEAAVWKAVHARAGRDFRMLGVLLVCLAPIVALVGFPISGWVFGVGLAALTVGVLVLPFVGWRK